jgi:hypothetical protein
MRLQNGQAALLKFNLPLDLRVAERTELDEPDV